MLDKEREKNRKDCAAYRAANRDAIAARRRAKYHQNREAHLIKRKANYAANREAILEKRKRELPQKRERINERQRAAYRNKKVVDPEFRERENARNRAAYLISIENPDYRARRRARHLADYHRRKSDPKFRMEQTLRTRIRKVLNGHNKSAKTLELLGCSLEFFRDYLEKQFHPGMTWNNYGIVWHVDHILPCAEFHLQHSEEQEICFHWTNLQPLFAKDNLSKSYKI